MRDHWVWRRAIAGVALERVIAQHARDLTIDDGKRPSAPI
jgi:hypothetical protein